MEKMASDNSYKRLAQLYRTMDTAGLTYKQMIVTEIMQDYIDIDYELPASDLFQFKMPKLLNSTALELAAKKKDIEIFNILIEHGADFTRKNKQGSTVLHQTIDSIVYSGESTSWVFDAERPKNSFAQSVLDAHVQYDNSSNPHNEHGLSHFHVACIINHTKAVEFFLKAGVSPNQTVNNDSPILPGYTPLHLAAKFGAIETLHVLLQTNVKIDAKNAKGMSALELLVHGKIEIWIERRKFIGDRSNFQINVELNERMTDMILRKFDPQTQVVDEATGLSRFHIACTTTDPEVIREQLKRDPDLQHSVNAKSTFWPGYSGLHFAAHYDFEVFELLLDAGANLEAVDSKGRTPLDICLQNFALRDIEAILRRKDHWANVRFSNGRTRLLDFVVALQDSGGFKAFLKDNFSDVNTRIPEDSRLCRGYTPLHLAVACCKSPHSCGRCIEACLQLRADVTAKNSQGSTPLHLAIHLGSVDLIRTLLDRQTRADNPRDNVGLSHLHIASLVDYRRLAWRFPRGSKDLEAPLKVQDFVWAKSSRIRNGATPLSVALSVGARETAEALVERGARIPVEDVERFAEINGARLLSRLHPLDVERALGHCEPEPLVAEMAKNAQLRHHMVERHGLTRLHVAVLVGEDIDELTDDANARVPLDSPLWPGCTALHLLVVGRRLPKAFSVARQLLDRGANVTLKNARGATPAHDAFDWFMRNEDATSLFDMLLSQSDANPIDCRGISHFHLAAMFNRVDVVEGFLRNGVDVDGKIDEFSDAFAGLTALHLAVAFGRDEVVKTLLAHEANVHCESVVGNRPMHVAATTSFAPEIGGVVKCLMSAGAEINVKNLFGETPVEVLLKSHTVPIEKVELFMNYGCNVNVVNPKSTQGILGLALILEDKSIYKCLIDAYDHNELDEFGRSAMHNIVLLNQSLCDLPKSNTSKWFIPVTDYVRVIQELTAMGMTPLHLAAMKQNKTGVIALLKFGADININDTKGFPPISDISRALKAISDTELGTEILENFCMYIWKLRYFKLHVSNFNLEAENIYQRGKSFRESKEFVVRKEIQSMDKEKIGSIALRDFLCETGVVAAYPTMSYDSRSSIDEYFESNFDRLLKEFPELSCLLLLQYRKARKRLDMTESCTTALNFLVNFQLPHLCSEPIFRFLTYDDLKNLIFSTSFE